MSRTKSLPIRKQLITLFSPVKKTTTWNIETPKRDFKFINNIPPKNIKKKRRTPMISSSQVIKKLDLILKPFNDYIVMILDGELEDGIRNPMITSLEVETKYQEFYHVDMYPFFPKLSERIVIMINYLKEFFRERIIPGILVQYGEGAAIAENVGRNICIHFVEHYEEL
jgi:hypothetical protein